MGEGVRVHLFDDEDPARCDSVFPNNWFSTHAGGRVAVYPMYSPSRRTERSTTHRTTHEGHTMKTMTCRQLAGPRDLQHRGETGDEVIQAQDKHLKEMEASGDATHQPARDDMKARWRHPKKSPGWYRDTKPAFDELPED